MTHQPGTSAQFVHSVSVVRSLLSVSNDDSERNYRKLPTGCDDRDPLADRVLLHVEDDDATAYLFQMGLQYAGIAARCFRVSDGELALDFLFRREPYRDAPHPDLVILDLNLPRSSGLEVLSEIRHHDVNLKVAVCSSSADERDRDFAMKRGASAYLAKGRNLSEFMEAVRSACALIPCGPVLRTT